MTNGPVLYQQHGGIVTLTLNRPESLNAMNEAMMGELERILIELEADAAVRAVVLTGAGRAFSSGGDQKRGAEEVRRRSSRAIGRGAHRAPEPLHPSHAAAAEAHRRQHQRRGAGAGMNIALATDLRIASETARFGEVFAAWVSCRTAGGRTSCRASSAPPRPWR